MQFIYNKIKRDINSAKVAFVNSIIKTRIKIINTDIYLYTYNSELLDRIKAKVKKEGYTFNIINNLSDMGFYSEWV